MRMDEDVCARRPRFENGWWVWDCAYADADGRVKSILHGQLFDLLDGNHRIRQRQKRTPADTRPIFTYADETLHKGYYTRWGAKRALLRAVTRYIKEGW